MNLNAHNTNHLSNAEPELLLFPWNSIAGIKSFILQMSQLKLQKVNQVAKSPSKEDADLAYQPRSVQRQSRQAKYKIVRWQFLKHNTPLLINDQNGILTCCVHFSVL